MILTDFGTFKPLMLPQVGLWDSDGFTVVRVDTSGFGLWFVVGNDWSDFSVKILEDS